MRATGNVIPCNPAVRLAIASQRRDSPSGWWASDQVPISQETAVTCSGDSPIHRLPVTWREIAAVHRRYPEPFRQAPAWLNSLVYNFTPYNCISLLARRVTSKSKFQLVQFLRSPESHLDYFLPHDQIGEK